MPITIDTQLNNQAVRLELGSAIKREELHGKTQIIPKLGDTTLQKAWLRPNGTLLLGSEKKSVETDPQGSPVEKPLAEAPATEPAPEAPCSLMPTDLSVIPEYQIDRVLPVTASPPVPEGVYTTTYKGPRSSRAEPALLISKQDGAFLLVGEKRPTLFIDHTPNYAFFTEPDTEENEGEDDLSIGF